MDNSKLLESLESVSSEKTTENGQFCYDTTKNSLLDFFSEVGALRNRSEEDIIKLFIKAYNEDRLLALKTLFYARNIRSGLGERETFKICLRWLAKNHSSDVKNNFANIAKFGRYDDFYSLMDTPLESDMLKYLKILFNNDMKKLKASEQVSLLGKWLPSCNASNKETIKNGKKTAIAFGLSERDYRKSLSALRKAINVVERNLSDKHYENIVYNNVPSKAAYIYKNAFKKHDDERYSKYLKDVSNGKAKINSSTMYPYELIKPLLKEYFQNKIDENEDEILERNVIEAQWKALPNYTSDKNFMVLADVSGSMLDLNATPMATSVGLAIYFAEHTKGIFHNNFMEFSDKSELIKLKDSMTLNEKVQVSLSNDFCGGTNIESAFNAILNAAIASNCKNSDLPDALVVITDMEIDQGLSDSNFDFSTEMQSKFSKFGYTMPIIVWWNVNARHSTFHSNYKNSLVRFISGSSENAFKSLCENFGDDPMSMMTKTLSDKRYDTIK